MLRCNGCWQECSHADHHAATACSHLFCLNCVQQIIESEDSCCPICSAVVTKNDVKAVHVLGDSRAFKLTLAGQTPEVAMSAAMAAIQFYNQQQELNAKLAQHQMQQRIDRTKQQCIDKLVPLKDAFDKAKRKYQEVSHEKKVLAEANHELTEKYNQKAIQDKKLKDALALLQQENDSLRRQVEQLMRGGGGAPPRGLAPTFGTGAGGMGGIGAGRASRTEGAAALGGVRPATKLARHQPAPDPSPLQSPNYRAPARSPAYQGGFAFETPHNPPPSLRMLQSSGGPGGAAGFVSQLGLPAMGRQDQAQRSAQFMPSNLGSL